MVKRYVWDEEGYPPDGMELVSAADYEEIAAESEARHQSCLVLMKSVQDHRERIRELEAALRKIMKFSADLDPDDNARQCGHYIESVARVVLIERDEARLTDFAKDSEP